MRFDVLSVLSSQGRWSMQASLTSDVTGATSIAIVGRLVPFFPSAARIGGLWNCFCDTVRERSAQHYMVSFLFFSYIPAKSGFFIRGLCITRAESRIYRTNR